ncbi:MAG: class I SAM-dependent methyltransferase [Planctomycetia bacterium]|nr:class I SAM-dependent methyltransferase [Planctomycetia bacterium]
MLSIIKFYRNVIKSFLLFARPALRFPVCIFSFLYFAKRYHLFFYNIALFMPLYLFSTLKGKSVLEIGGSNLPEALIFGKFKAKRWICLDYLEWWREGVSSFLERKDTVIHSVENIYSLQDATPELLGKKHAIFNGVAEDLPDCFREKFDMVVSICAMEHINHLPESIDKIYQALKPGGTFYACFAPIWSGALGNHFWIGGQDSKLNFNGIPKNGVPKHAHLRISEEDLRKLLAARYSPETIDEICRQTYHSDFINRLFYEDYVQIFQESSFASVEIRSWWPMYLSLKYREELQKRYPPYKNFEDNGIIIFARK